MQRQSNPQKRRPKKTSPEPIDPGTRPSFASIAGSEWTVSVANAPISLGQAVRDLRLLRKGETLNNARGRLRRLIERAEKKHGVTIISRVQEREHVRVTHAMLAKWLPFLYQATPNESARQVKGYLAEIWPQVDEQIEKATAGEFSQIFATLRDFEKRIIKLEEHKTPHNREENL